LAESASHLLQSFDEGVIRGKSEEIVVRLLNSSDKSLRREALRGLWGAKYGETISDRVIELVDNKESHHDAIYYALSTSPEKTPAAVDKLIEVLSDPDWNNWGRAIWGLGYGVPEDQQKKVAAAMLQMYELRSDPKTRGKCDRLIREYGDKEQISKLDEMAGSTAQTPSDRGEQGTDEVETKVDDVLEGDEPQDSELVEEEKVE
jgi:HEAT repeat protein